MIFLCVLEWIDWGEEEDGEMKREAQHAFACAVERMTTSTSTSANISYNCGGGESPTFPWDFVGTFSIEI